MIRPSIAFRVRWRPARADSLASDTVTSSTVRSSDGGPGARCARNASRRTLRERWLVLPQSHPPGGIGPLPGGILVGHSGRGPAPLTPWSASTKSPSPNGILTIAPLRVSCSSRGAGRRPPPATLPSHRPSGALDGDVAAPGGSRPSISHSARKSLGPLLEAAGRSDAPGPSRNGGQEPRSVRDGAPVFDLGQKESQRAWSSTREVLGPRLIHVSQPQADRPSIADTARARSWRVSLEDSGDLCAARRPHIVRPF